MLRATLTKKDTAQNQVVYEGFGLARISVILPDITNAPDTITVDILGYEPQAPQAAKA